MTLNKERTKKNLYMFGVFKICCTLLALLHTARWWKLYNYFSHTQMFLWWKATYEDPDTLSQYKHTRSDLLMVIVLAQVYHSAWKKNDCLERTSGSRAISKLTKRFSINPFIRSMQRQNHIYKFPLSQF